MGIPASTTIVQHMVLVVGMLGGAIAARDKRLLSLSTLGETSFRGRWKNASRIFTYGVSAAVTAFLGLASYQFVEAEREAGQILAYRIPMWVVESVLPIGFAVIAIRILLHTSEKWGPRTAAALCALLLVGTVMAWPGGKGWSCSSQTTRGGDADGGQGSRSGSRRRASARATSPMGFGCFEAHSCAAWTGM